MPPAKHCLSARLLFVEQLDDRGLVLHDERGVVSRGLDHQPAGPFP